MLIEEVWMAERGVSEAEMRCHERLAMEKYRTGK